MDETNIAPRPNTQPGSSASFWGDVAAGLSSIVQTGLTDLNPKVRDYRLAMAQTQATTAQANASAAASSQGFDPKILLYVFIGVIILLMAFSFMKK